MKDKQNELFADIIGILFYMGMMIPFLAVAEFIFGIPSWGALVTVIVPMFVLLLPTTFIIGKLEVKQQKVKSVE